MAVCVVGIVIILGDSFMRREKKKLEYSQAHFLVKWIQFYRWFFVDIWRSMRKRKSGEFKEFGLHLYVGVQGQGKTVGMVERAYQLKKMYPNCIIVANFDCDIADVKMTSWKDLFEIRSPHGVVYLIDEISSEYDSTKWKEVNGNFLRMISMQRKARVHIIASGQIYGRIVKQLREQSRVVVECRCYFKRIMFLRAFDAYDYESFESNPDRKYRLRRLWRRWYIADDRLRNMYDTYEMVQSLKDKGYMPDRVIGANGEVMNL